jgi:hypothetical protein
VIACMGGWCRQRDKCAHYLLPPHPPQENPAERLCSLGKTDSFIPVQIDYTPKAAKQKETA